LSQTTLGSLQRSPRPLAGCKGPTSKGRRGEGTGERRKERAEGEGRRKGGEGKEGEECLTPS